MWLYIFIGILLGVMLVASFAWFWSKQLRVAVKKRTKELRKSNERFRSLVLNIPGVHYRCINDKYKTIEYISDAIEALSGYSASDFVDNNVRSFVSIIHPDDINKVEQAILHSLTRRGTFNVEYRILRNDGKEKWVFEKARVISNDKGKITHLDGIILDITEKKLVEVQLNHSRKLDAIGQLSGGIAHDFNNMLAGIMSIAQLLQSPKRNLDSNSLRFVDMILQTTTRAADLTEKLLVFGRKGKNESVHLNCHNIIDETVDLLSRTIDKKFQFIINKNAEKFIVLGDNSGIQNSLINICVNASQAMPNGGDIFIETRNISLTQTFCTESSFDIIPGEFIEINIRDTGCGIDLDNINQIFEPFYTTKGEGEGTGLGLSTVFGMVQEHKGAINVVTEFGKGTVFHIYLPYAGEIAEYEKDGEIVFEGTGKILLIDDENIIRLTGREILEDMGYSVILAENGEIAVDLYKDNYKDITLIIMDMIMPKMDGYEAFFKLKEINPDAKIIISSGFSKTENIDKLFKNGLNAYIKKPYKDSELSQLIVKILKL